MPEPTVQELPPSFGKMIYDILMSSGPKKPCKDIEQLKQQMNNCILNEGELSVCSSVIQKYKECHR